MNASAAHLPDASDIGLSVSLFRRATPQWLIYDAMLAGENVVAWRYLPSHCRQSGDGAALWTKLPNWVVAGDLSSDQTGMVPRLAAYSHQSSSGWLVYPKSPRALDKPLTDRKKLADLANHLLASLDQLHKRDTLHLDVHPSNIRENGDRFVLAGLGLDVRVQAGAATGSNAGLARKSYAPPEMWDASGRSPLGPWTDIFAAAATLYYAICGKEPADFRDRMNRPRWREAIAYDLNRELAKSGAAWPKMVDFIIAGLALKIDERPKSVSDWSQVWKEPVSNTPASFISRPDHIALQSPLTGDAVSTGKPNMMHNGMMGALGLALGAGSMLLFVAMAVPALLSVFGFSLESGAALPPYGTMIALLVLQIATVLAVDGFFPRLNVYARTGFLLPPFLGMLAHSWAVWNSAMFWRDALNIISSLLLFASLSQERSKMQQIFYRYSGAVIVVGIILLFLKIYSYADVLHWLNT